MKGPSNNAKIGLGLGTLEIVSALAGLIVVLGLLFESGPEIWDSIINRKIPGRGVVGGALVALGVFGEVAVAIFISRSAKREKIESDSAISAANERAAGATLARVKLEEQLLRTIGPRRISPEQRERIAIKIREFLAEVPFSILVLTTLNVEDSRESMDFAWQLADTLNEAGKEAPIYTGPELFPWEPNDIWIRLPSPPWSNIARLVTDILKSEHLKVVSSSVSGLPLQLWHATERNGSGRLVATPDAAKESIGIVVAKRSQPILRMDA